MASQQRTNQLIELKPKRKLCLKCMSQKSTHFSKGKHSLLLKNYCASSNYCSFLLTVTISGTSERPFKWHLGTFWKSIGKESSLQCEWREFDPWSGKVRSHMPRGNSAHTPQPESPSATKKDPMCPKRPTAKKTHVPQYSGDRSKVWCCKEKYCIGTWNVRSIIKANWKWSNRSWQEGTSTF